MTESDQPKEANQSDKALGRINKLFTKALMAAAGALGCFFVAYFITNPFKKYKDNNIQLEMIDKQVAKIECRLDETNEIYLTEKQKVETINEQLSLIGTQKRKLKEACILSDESDRLHNEICIHQAECLIKLASLENSELHLSKAIHLIKSIAGQEAVKDKTKYQCERMLGDAYLFRANLRARINYANEAIRHYKRALKMKNVGLAVADEIRIHNSIGKAYYLLTEAQNQSSLAEKSYFHHEKALLLIGKTDQDSQIKETEITRTYLGRATGILGQLNRDPEEVQKAISLHDEALKILTRQNYPKEYATVQVYKGRTLQRLFLIIPDSSTKRKNDLLNETIECFERAEDILSEEEHRLEHIRIRSYLAVCYTQLSKLENDHAKKYKLLQVALKTLGECSGVRLNDFPLDYGILNIVKGMVYQNYYYVTQNEDHFSEAIDCYEKALETLTLNEDPIPHVHNQINIGVAYSIRAERRKAEADPEKASAIIQDMLKAGKAYKAALAADHLEKYNYHSYIATVLNLAISHHHLARALTEKTEKIENLENALDAYQIIEAHHQKEGDVLDLARVQANLGLLYHELYLSSRDKTMLQKALDYYRKALGADVFKRSDTEDYRKTEKRRKCAQVLLDSNGSKQCRYDIRQ